MTWIARLSVLCTMSTLMQMALPEQRAKGSIKVICGLLMLRMTADRIDEMAQQLSMQHDLAGFFACMMG